MSEREDERITPGEERTRALLRGSESPRADAEFRERLREAFVSGRIAEGGAAGRPHPVPIRRPWYARTPARLAVGAAAALVLVVAGSILNRGPAWTVTSAEGTGEVRLDGDWVPIERLKLLQQGVRPGVEIQVPAGGQLEIMSPGVLAIQLTPGTELTVPPPPSRWIGRNVELYARAGELRITTGSAFRGAQLEVNTPHARVEVTGTTLAVIMEAGGTCVCVLEGGVRMGPRGNAMVPVGAGTLCYAFPDDRPMKRSSIRSEERMKLAAFRAMRVPMLEGKWEE